MRRFPAPWTVEALDGGFQIVDANGQALAYVYGAGSCHQASDGIGRLGTSRSCLRTRSKSS